METGFSLVHSERARSNGLKLQQKNWTSEKLFTKVGEHWNLCPKGSVKSPFVEI